MPQPDEPITIPRVVDLVLGIGPIRDVYEHPPGDGAFPMDVVDGYDPAQLAGSGRAMAEVRRPLDEAARMLAGEVPFGDHRVWVLAATDTGANVALALGQPVLDEQRMRTLAAAGRRKTPSWIPDTELGAVFVCDARGVWRRLDVDDRATFMHEVFTDTPGAIAPDLRAERESLGREIAQAAVALPELSGPRSVRAAYASRQRLRPVRAASRAHRWAGRKQHALYRLSLHADDPAISGDTLTSAALAGLTHLPFRSSPPWAVDLGEPRLRRHAHTAPGGRFDPTVATTRPVAIGPTRG